MQIIGASFRARSPVDRSQLDVHVDAAHPDHRMSIIAQADKLPMRCFTSIRLKISSSEDADLSPDKTGLLRSLFQPEDRKALPSRRSKEALSSRYRPPEGLLYRPPPCSS